MHVTRALLFVMCARPSAVSLWTLAARTSLGTVLAADLSTSAMEFWPRALSAYHTRVWAQPSCTSPGSSVSAPAVNMARGKSTAGEVRARSYTVVCSNLREFVPHPELEPRRVQRWG